MTTADKDSDASESTKPERPFKSNLSEGKQRFLAHVIDHGFRVGRRSPEDFVRHFPPAKIMQGLRHRPPLRASILVPTTGVRRKIALRKSAESAADDLQIALDESETTSKTIVELFERDDCVRYLDNQDLWRYAVEGSFWEETDDVEQRDVARDHIAFMLERALDDDLITHQQIVDGITVPELARCLPKEDLGTLIRVALDNAHLGNTFTDRDLLDAMPASVLVEYVPLQHIWDQVIIPCIAEPCGFARREEEPPTIRPSDEPADEDEAPQDGEAKGNDGAAASKAAPSAKSSLKSPPPSKKPSPAAKTNAKKAGKDGDDEFEEAFNGALRLPSDSPEDWDIVEEDDIKVL
ncbi:MAG: hypothetical protein R3B72_47825 [Polyangiaceae bacterium]